MKRWARFRARLPRPKIHVRIFLFTSLLGLMSIGGTGGVLITLQYDGLRTQLYRLYLTRLVLLERNLLESAGAGVPDGDQLIRAAQLMDPEDTVFLFGPRGEPLRSSLIENSFEIPDEWKPLGRELGASYFDALRERRAGDADFIVLASRLPGSRGTAVVIKPLHAALRPIRTTLFVEFAALGFLVAAAFGLAVVLARRQIRPFVQMQEAVEAAASGDLSFMPRHGLWDERREIFKRLNRVRLRLRRYQALNAQTAVEDLKALRAAYHALEKNKTAVIAGLSHEIRSPLHLMLGLSELLLESPVLPEKDKKDVRDIIRAGEAIVALVERELEAARAGATIAMGEHNVPFRLGDNVVFVRNLFADAAAKKKITLACETAAGCPDELSGDVLRLRQVLTNLVGNAVKFTSKGAVHLYVELLSISSGACWLRFIVRDTGIGIPADQTTSIFEEFVQAGPEIQEQYGGTGLGLAITKRIVESLGGTIKVESATGEGSTFTVELPFSTGR